MKGQWNGDPNLLDGRLEKLRAQYDERLAASKNPTPDSIAFLSNKFEEDREYLRRQLSSAAELLKTKTDDKKTKDEKLKELSWEVVEISSLLDQAGLFLKEYNLMSETRDYRTHNELKVDLDKYHKGLFKKKRQPAATHVLVIMASEERRRFKPYALPIQYIPYHTITSQQVLVFVDEIKKKMVEMEMKCVGKYIM